MSDNFIQLNEDLIKHDLKDLVRSSVEETLSLFCVLGGLYLPFIDYDELFYVSGGLYLLVGL